MPYTEGASITHDEILLRPVNPSHIEDGTDIQFSITKPPLQVLGKMDTASKVGQLVLIDDERRLRIVSQDFQVVGDLLSPKRDDIIRDNIAHVFGQVATHAARMPGKGQLTLF